MILDFNKPERISKIISSLGLRSRRDAEKLIDEGRITLNGEKIMLPGTKATLSKDVIAIDGKIVEAAAGERKYDYYLLNKPKGYLTTCRDPFSRKTIFDLLDLDGHYFPVGRLDLDSRGLVLITNDGLLCELIIHPRNEIKKTYVITIDVELDAGAIDELKRGVVFENETYRAFNIEKKSDGVYKVELTEGKKREIRRMMEAVGRRVLDLFRVAIGPLSVEGIKEGCYRKLGEDEVKALKKYTGYEKAVKMIKEKI